MNYKMFNDLGSYKVLETTTEQTVGLFSTELEARKFLRHLNFGGGFDGWSPAFVLRSMKTHLKKNIKSKS